MTFQTLHIGNADDNDGGVEDLEIYGYFQVESSVDVKSVVRGNFPNWSEHCPNEALFARPSAMGTKGLGCPEEVSNGSWDIAEFENCIDSTKSIKVCKGTIIPNM